MICKSLNISGTYLYKYYVLCITYVYYSFLNKNTVNRIFANVFFRRNQPTIFRFEFTPDLPTRIRKNKIIIIFIIIAINSNLRKLKIVVVKRSNHPHRDNRSTTICNCYYCMKMYSRTYVRSYCVN